MIDIHCHLTHPGLDEIKEKVIEDARKVMDCIITCAYPKDVKKALELSKKHKDFVYLTLGLHPIDISKMNDKEIENYLEFIRDHADDIVGIGEIGLDEHWFPNGGERYRKVFVKCLELAKELDLPVILHLRKAEQEGFDIVTENKMKNVVFHSYAGNLTLAKRIMEEFDGYYISIGTNLMRSKNTKKIAKNYPLDRLLTETDAPFLSPYPDIKINLPQNVKFTLEKMSELRKKPMGEIDKVIMDNCRKIFDFK
jgi:TatD DNase family protein